MTNEKIDRSVIESFILPEEKRPPTLSDEDALRILSEHAKLKGTSGEVTFVNPPASARDKIRIFIAVRYFAAKLALTDTSLGIRPSVGEVTVQDMCNLLGVETPHARARMSEMVKSSMAKRVDRGIIEAQPEAVYDLVRELAGISKFVETQIQSTQRNNNFDLDAYQRISLDANIPVELVKEVLKIQSPERILLKKVPEKSKLAAQRAYALVYAYVLAVCFRKYIFTTGSASKAMFNANVDSSRISHALTELKRKGHITPVKRRSQQLTMTEDGKGAARRLILRLIEL